MIASLGTETNFLGLRVVDVSTMVLLVLLVLELAVVHDPADGRLFHGRDLDEIESRLACRGEGLIGRNDSKLFAILSDDANGRDSDIFIEPSNRLTVGDWYVLSNCEALAGNDPHQRVVPAASARYLPSNGCRATVSYDNLLGAAQRRRRGECRIDAHELSSDVVVT